MHKIIKTTDGKFLNRMIDIDEEYINLDDFIFKTVNIKYKDDGMIELSNDNYIIEVVLVNELK